MLDNSEEEESSLFRSELTWRALDVHSYRSTHSDDYLSTFPPSHLEDSSRESIDDHEPHCCGIGYYDAPDLAGFSNLAENHDMSCTRIHLTSGHDILSLLTMTHEPIDKWKLWKKIIVFAPDLSYPEEILKNGADIDSCVPSSNLAEISSRCNSIIEASKLIIMDCEDWLSCDMHADDHSCLSAVFLALFILLPKLEGLKIRNLHWGEIDIFALFPNPQTLYHDHRLLNVSLSPLKTLWFDKCHVSSADVLYIADCCTEHQIFPELRNLKFYYCIGMSYPSITSYLYSAVNLDFDRWECSGWCWPQEPINSKNESVHV